MVKKVCVYFTLVALFLLMIGNVGAAEIMRDELVDTHNIDKIIAYPKINELTSEYANAYKIDDHTISYVVDSQKINFKDKYGNWQTVNDAITMSASEPCYLFENMSNDFKVSFGLNDSQLLTKISKDSHWISFSMQTQHDTTLSMTNGVIEQGCGYLADINSRPNSIIYKNVDENCDIAYTVFGDTLKEDIVLYSMPKSHEISYVVRSSGLGFYKTTSDINYGNESIEKNEKSNSEIGVFYDLSTNKDVFRIVDLYMIDASGRMSNPLLWSYDVTSDGCLLKIYYDEEFLLSPSTEYPVIVDPTVQGSSVTFDTYASRTYPDTNYYLNSYIRTGCDATYGKRRTFIKWTFPSIDNKYPIESAHLELYKYSSSGSISLRALRIKTNWTSSTVTWWNSPDCDTSVIYGSGLVNNWYQIYLTDFAKRWRYSMYPNYGVKIYNSIEDDNNIWATFCSSDYSTTSYTPKLVIYVNTSNLYYMIGSHYISNIIPLDLDELTSYYSYFTTAISRWNSSEANCYFYINNNSGNRVYVDNTAQGLAWVGAGGNPYSSFEIGFNSTSLTNWLGTYYFYECSIAVFLHELGHTLGLVDMGDEEPDHNFCVMGHGVENIIVYPTASDIAGVNAIW